MSPMELLRRAVSDLSPDGGWASRTLHQSMRRAILLAVCCWQVVMIWAVVNTPAPLVDKCWLGFAHLVLMVVALLAGDERFPAGLLLVLVYVVVLWDWAVADSIDGVLCFAGLWTTNLAAAAPTFVMRGRRAIALPVGMALAVPLGLYTINPDWGTTLPSAVGVTTLAILAATRLGVPFLIGFANRADAEAAAAEEAARAAAVVRTSSREAAEDARILHDTVINTLGAIANGGSGIEDLHAVRERCARDAVTVEELQSAGHERLERDDHLREIFGRSGAPLRRTGLDDDALGQIELSLSTQVIPMIVRAVKELLQNVDKHAQADHVAVDVRVTDHDLILTVTDDGIGFDGAVPSNRGLASSVLGRAQQAGVSVVLDTAPGRGTTVTLRKRLDEHLVPDSADSLADRSHQDAEIIVAGLRARAGWVCTPALVAVGIVIESVNRFGQLTAAYGMLAVVGLVAAFAWTSRDRDGRLPTFAVVTLAIGASIAFVLSAAAVDFGRTDAVFWQAIGPTGPLIVILAVVPKRSVLLGAVGLFAATVGACTAVVWQDSADAASIIPVAGMAALGLVATWNGFQRAISTIGAQAVADHRAAVGSRLDAAVRVAADDVRMRWRAAGLNEAVDLLQSVADGRVAPSAGSTRAACAREEAYLRQLTQLNPDLVRMGHWFARALYDGRDRETQLLVRTGEVDAPDEETATTLGAVLLDAVSSMPRGALLTATIFPSSDGLRMTLVSPRSHLAQAHRTWAPSPESTMTYQSVEDQDLVEIVVRDATLQP